jgi:hypothetical protein
MSRRPWKSIPFGQGDDRGRWCCFREGRFQDWGFQRWAWTLAAIPTLGQSLQGGQIEVRADSRYCAFRARMRLGWVFGLSVWL